MLPIASNSNALDHYKPVAINQRASQQNQQTEDNSYQDVITSLNQKSESISSASEASLAAAGKTGTEALAEEAKTLSDELAKQEANQESNQELGQVSEQLTNPLSAQLSTQLPTQGMTQTPGQESAPSSTKNSTQARPLDSVSQSNEQVAVSQSKQAATSASGQAVKTTSSEPVNKNADIMVNPDKLVAENAAARETNATSSRINEYTPAQPATLIYGQKGLAVNASTQEAQSLASAQSMTLTGNGSFNSSEPGNNSEVLKTALIDPRFANNTPVSSEIKSIIEASAAKHDSSITDMTMAERTQTASGKYEWSMLKLDSQKQTWSKQLFNTLQDRIEMQFNQQIKQAKIRLDPPELGRLELTVRMEGDKMSVTLHASNSSVREALQETNERLRQELENQFGSAVDVNVGGDSFQEEFKNEDQEVALSRVEATENEQASTPLTTGWLNALA